MLHKILIATVLISSLCLTSCQGKRTGAVCRDGTHSMATGSGACSHHGGVDHWKHE